MAKRPSPRPLKTAAQLDAEIAEALTTKSREETLRKLVRRAIRGLEADDGATIQERVEHIVRIANKTGGPQIGIQGDLSQGEDSIEVWEVGGDPGGPILGIELDTGEVVFR